MDTSTRRTMAWTSPTGPTEASDATLILASRSGDLDAIATLYSRHCAAALRAARAIGGHGLAEDLAAEAFTRVLATIRAGGGPDRALRPYLVTTIRHLFVDAVRRGAREVLVGENSDVMDRAQPDDCEARAEQSVMFEVLAALPPRWREVLWRTIVLDEPLSAVGASMGLNANAVAALSFRARAGLGRAYRDRVVPTMPSERACDDGSASRSA
jgi:RNA polymerase sigma factor (sigma-70 family)